MLVLNEMVLVTSKPGSAVQLEMRLRSFVHSVPLVLEGRQDVAIGLSPNGDDFVISGSESISNFEEGIRRTRKSVVPLKQQPEA